MKKPINTNPFKRPFSQNLPKRQQAEEPSKAGQLNKKPDVEQSKTITEAYKPSC